MSKKRFDFGYVTSSLPAYTEQEADSLMVKTIFGSKTISMLTPKVGIKSAEALGLLDTDAIIQAGGSCGFNSQGTTTISQRTITVGKLKVQEQLCPPDLEAFFTQKALQAGSNYDMVAFAKDYTDFKIARINRANEVEIWQNNLTGTPTAGLSNLYDGLIRTIDHTAPGGAIEANATAYITGGVVSSITQANIIAIMNGMYKAIPPDILDATDVKTFMGWDSFRQLISAITATNFFHYDTDASAKSGEMILPGTNLSIVAVNGLNATNRMFAFQRSNAFVGTDLMDEWDDDFSFKYDEINEVMKFSSKYKLGTQVAFPTQIVKFTIPPGS